MFFAVGSRSITGEIRRDEAGDHNGFPLANIHRVPACYSRIALRGADGCKSLNPSVKREDSVTVLGEYEICSDIARIDWARVHGWLTTSYWTPGISLERVRRGGENSALVLGAYWKGAEQAGYLRVVSDKTRFAYLCDVWVEEKHRGKGLARAMVQVALEHPDFATVNWLLATQDAHGVYAKLGFTPLQHPDRWMSKGRFCTET
jgi:GNAT superfamily N-acetyltransferase